MKYLVLLIFIACNSSEPKQNELITTGTSTSVTDSVGIALDSLKESLGDISAISDYAINAQSKINKLNKEKEELLQLIDNDPPRLMAYRSYSHSNDTSTQIDYDKMIADLQREVSFLRRRIYNDSSYIARFNNKEAVELKVEKPNDSSLIIKTEPYYDFNIYLIPYSKEVKKKIMVYEMSCDLSLINKLGGRVSGIYNGQHFFNNVPAGKYVIKFCTYLANYQVIERTDGKQVIILATSPPIK